MAAEEAAHLRGADLTNPATPPLLVPLVARIDIARRHVINRAMQEKSGRLYCGDDLEFDVPSYELYAAR
jgi:hypothetical protein